MRTLPRLLVAAVAFAASSAALFASGQYLQVEYPASTQPGELQLGVTYNLWIPGGVKELRGVIVHQHGCGTGACYSGEVAANDLHWQALAKKWDCALMGPFYHQTEKQNCRLWCDPRNGSERTFLQALDDLAAKSGHPELKTAPWCLWGHSGGGFWASLIQMTHPERIVAIWFRSGTAFGTWEKGEIPKPEIPAAAYEIPMMFNVGVKEKGVIAAGTAMGQAYRANGAPFGFAIDPKTGHECGDSRYLAIPFFDACLAMRLPEKGAPGAKLKPVDLTSAWFTAQQTDTAQPAAGFTSKREEAWWLPNERIAKLWEEYVKTGDTDDATPPPAPHGLKVASNAEGAVELTWDAEADFESGLQAFIVQRDGQDVARLPEKPSGKFGRPLFQRLAYHDTPEKPLAEMRFTDTAAKPGEKHEYRVVAVNSVGLKSEPSAPAAAP